MPSDCPSLSEQEGKVSAFVVFFPREANPQNFQSSRSRGAGCVRFASLAGAKLAVSDNKIRPTNTQTVTMAGETAPETKSLP